MAPSKRNKSETESTELLRNIQDIRNELKRLRRENVREEKAKDDIIVNLSEAPDLEERFDNLSAKVKEMATSLDEVKDFLFQNATGARPFIYQNTIKEAMLEFGTAERWKAKCPRELVQDLTTVQRALNEKREFTAANELQGFVEVAEVGREVVIINPMAETWINKGLQEATATVLCQGRERRGQAIFWSCLQRQLIDKLAEQEKKLINKFKSAKSSGEVAIPCQNCTKNGLFNVMHSIAECAKLKNPCRLECRQCPPEPGTGAIPCHWRQDCPGLRKADQKSSSSRSTR